jgi:hypothetical protein
MFNELLSFVTELGMSGFVVNTDTEVTDIDFTVH